MCWIKFIWNSLPTSHQIGFTYVFTECFYIICTSFWYIYLKENVINILKKRTFSLDIFYLGKCNLIIFFYIGYFPNFYLVYIATTSQWFKTYQNNILIIRIKLSIISNKDYWKHTTQCWIVIYRLQINDWLCKAFINLILINFTLFLNILWLPVYCKGKLIYKQNLNLKANKKLIINWAFVIATKISIFFYFKDNFN